MLVVTITINGVDTVIGTEYIKDTHSVEEKISVGTSKIIASEYDLVIDNTDRNIYDGRDPDSIFYISETNDWYNADIRIYDDNLNQPVFTGRIKNIITDDKDNSVTISAANIVRELADAVCVVSDFTGTQTPAGIIYAILTDEAGLNIPYELIRTFDFQQAIAYQEQNNLFVRIEYNTAHNVKCINVINELLNLSMCSLATINNAVGIYQWRAWTAESGQVINGNVMMPGTFSQEYDDSGIINSYTIEYYSNGSIGSISGKNAASVAKYGERPLVIPSTAVKDKTPESYRILLQSSLAASFVGESYIARDKERKMVCTFTVSEECSNYVHVNSDIFLTYDNYISEPVKITDYKAGTTGLIQLKGIFLNRPFGISRVVSAPEPPRIQSAFGMGGNTIRLSVITNEAAAGYRFYIKAGDAVEIIDKKITYSAEPSTVDLVVEPFTEYSIQITTYNKQLIESSKSNPVSVMTHNLADISNKYCTSGSLLEGVTLDSLNSKSGHLTSDMFGALGKYGTFKYGFSTYQSIRLYTYGGFIYGTQPLKPCAVYMSEIIGLSGKKAEVICSGDIEISYREYGDGSWGEWSTPARGVPFIPVVAQSMLIQIRAIFHSTAWSSGDFCKLLEV